MPEQRSIVLSALLAAILLAGGLFYFFFSDTAPGAIDTQVVQETPLTTPEGQVMAADVMTGVSPSPKAMAAAEVTAQQAAQGALPSSSPEVAGATRGVTPTAQTGPADYVPLIAVFASVLGLFGLVRIAFRSL